MRRKMLLVGCNMWGDDMWVGRDRRRNGLVIKLTVDGVVSKPLISDEQLKELGYEAKK